MAGPFDPISAALLGCFALCLIAFYTYLEILDTIND